RRRVRLGSSAVGDPPMWSDPLTGGSGGQVDEVATPAAGGFESDGLSHSAACSNLPLKPLNRGILSPVVDPLLVKRGSQAAYCLCLGAHRRGGRGSRRQAPVLVDDHGLGRSGGRL